MSSVCLHVNGCCFWVFHCVFVPGVACACSLFLTGGGCQFYLLATDIGESDWRWL